jgi:hypothetical protein
MRSTIDVVLLPATSGRTEPTVALQPLPPGLKHRFHAMVKPVGSMCDLYAHIRRDMPKILQRIAGPSPSTGA